jgi:ribosomal protein L11 methyltransferase
VVAFFLSRAAADFASHVLEGEGTDIGVRTVADEGWEGLARLAWQPFAILDDLWVYPNDREAPAGRLAIHLDPGLAFGTGTHPTTRLCLQWLYRSLKGRKTAKTTVLDFGCGSGILAIAALRLGAAHALGIDVDPLALESARQNARRNGVGDRMHTRFPPLLADERFDLVVANILAEPLIAHKAILCQALAVGGRLALSGILEDQVERVRAAFPEFDLALTIDEDWCLLEGGRR